MNQGSSFRSRHSMKSGTRTHGTNSSSPRPHGIPPEIPVIGQLPKEWKWGPDLLPMVLWWHAELEWLKMPPAHDHIPRAHWQVSFMELALDFEAFTGRPLPPAPRSKYAGGDLSLQEKGRVLRLIATLVGRATECESIFPARMTHHCRSLTSMGAGLVMGLEGHPVFTRPTTVWKPGEASHIRGSQMGTKAKSMHGEVPGQNEGHGQETSRKVARSSSESREEVVPSEGWSKKRAQALCDRLLCEAKEGSSRTEGRSLRAVRRRSDRRR